ncbi:hypothetical protein ACFL6S_03435 [Candidatus Poribacteria bacterium]
MNRVLRTTGIIALVFVGVFLIIKGGEIILSMLGSPITNIVQLMGETGIFTFMAFMIGIGIWMLYYAYKKFVE